MSKQITFRKEARAKMLKGLDIAAEAVGGTLGPKGLNVFLDDPVTPKITNDGAKIADRITLEDAEENAGVWVVKNTSAQTNDDVGDGTTTTVVVLQAIIHEAEKRPEDPKELEASLLEAGNKALKLLAKQSVKITKKDVEKVALISAENADLAKMIAEIINKLGEKAVINVEDSKTFATEYEIVEGYEAHVGFMSPHFINDKKAQRAVFQDVPIFVSEKKISNIQDISPLFEQFKTQNISQCVIVCEDIEDSMLGLFVTNKNLGTFNALVIRATGPLLKDIEGATGAKAVSDSNGITFQTVKVEHMGRAKKVICDANKTLFLGNAPSSKAYAASLEKQADGEPNQFTQKKMRERVAKLRGGVAVLRVGASTDLEREYLKDKAEDTVKAVQAALEEGVVEGGGMALWRISQAMNPKTPGEHILKRALTAPLRRIVENAGKDYAEVIRAMPEGHGYDAKKNWYFKMIDAGIIDPAKVERCALENSVSSAAKFITSFCIVTEYKENAKAGKD